MSTATATTATAETEVEELSPASARTVPLEELRQAWAALAAGDFRPRRPRTSTGPSGTVATPPAVQRPPGGPAAWTPTRGEDVLPVVGSGGSCGASTLAVALATAAVATGPRPGRTAHDNSPADGRSLWRAARVVDCGSLTASGLAGASTSELGRHPSGWWRGTREEVLLERADGYVAGPETLSPPCPWPDHDPEPDPEPDLELELELEPGGRLTVLDVGWDLERVLHQASWLRSHLLTAERLVLTAPATVPGMRRLEVDLELLAAVTESTDSTNSTNSTGAVATAGAEPGTTAGRKAAVVVAVQGAPRRRWPRPLAHSLGPRTRALDAQGLLAVLPQDRRLAVAGLDPAPLPALLLAAAARLLDRTPTVVSGAPR